MASYREEVQERRLEIQQDERARWDNAATALAGSVEETIRNLGIRSATAVIERQEWEEWAYRLLYGDDYVNHPDWLMGRPSDLRSWIADRASKMSAHSVKRIAELEAENLRLSEIISLLESR